MARSRNIKPGFFKNEDLAEIHPLGRILFAGLWCLADREGRLEDRSKRIKADILPYDDCDVDSLLEVLHQNHFIIRYRVEGERYIEVVNFKKHQNPHKKEAESVLPAAPEIPERASEIPERAVLIPDSLSLDSLIPDSFNPSLPPLGTRKPFRSKKQQDRFDQFWQQYPRKKSKGQAEKAWAKINPDEQLVATMLATIERAKTAGDWQKSNGDYIPHPATWLNAKGWEDEHEEAIPNGINRGKSEKGNDYERNFIRAPGT